MSNGAGFPALAVRAAEASEALGGLFSDLQEVLAATLGIELLELRSSGVDGRWVLTCSFGSHVAPGGTAQPADAPAARAEESLAPDPEPPFVSPILGCRPFEGDGTSDLQRFIQQGDERVVVPPVAAGPLPTPLSDDARARLLAATVAGDLVLALMHEGLATDPERLGAALDEGWERYAAEVRRIEREPDPELYRRAGDLAATMIVEVI